jgi:hypothetical protein
MIATQSKSTKDRVHGIAIRLSLPQRPFFGYNSPGGDHPERTAMRISNPTIISSAGGVGRAGRRPGRALGLALLVPALAFAQLGGGGGAGGGGVHIDPEGILRPGVGKGKPAKREVSKSIDRELEKKADLRRISLKALDREVRSILAAGKPLPEEIRNLGGLTRLDYLLFDADSEDVLLVGPAEPWTRGVERDLGKISKRPVLTFDDLTVALRTVLAGSGVASCSIDPQPAGLAAMKAWKTPPASNPKEAEQARRIALEKLGNQTVRTGGVPEGSRFARVMVEADYRMKRIALGLEKFTGIESHLDILAQRNRDGGDLSTMARWWFMPGYEGVVRNEAGTLFRLKGPAWKLLNEEQVFDANGQRTGLGKTNPDFDRFCKTFNAKATSLELAVTPIGDLRNLFDLGMFAGLIRHEGKANWLAGTVFLDESAYQVEIGSQPKFAEPVAATRLDKKNGTVLCVVSWGGVTISPADVLSKPSAIAADSTGELGRTGDLLLADRAVRKPADAAKPDAPKAEASGTWWADFKAKR